MRNIVTLRPEFRLFPEGDDEAMAFAADAGPTVGDPTRKAPEVTGAEVGQFMLLPVGPEILPRVQFGRRGWPAAGAASAGQRFEVLVDRGGTRAGRAGPDDQQFAGEVTLPVAEELNDLRALDAAGQEPEVKVAPSQSGDGSKVFPIEAMEEPRRLPLGRPSPHARRLLRQAALVEEDDRAAFGAGLFFNAGQVWRFQVARAASARATGCWQLQPNRARKTRRAVVAWQAKPNSRRMTLATRCSVHNGVAKPAASGPATRIFTNACSRPPSSRGWRPARPAARRASLPPASRWQFQRNTDWRLTLVRRATSAWGSPFSNRVMARKRRFSSALKARRVAMPGNTATTPHAVTILCNAQLLRERDVSSRSQS